MHPCVLAGVGRTDAGTVRMWYRRSFTVPGSWLDPSSDGPRADRVMLNFGAVDWEAEVFVNGQRLGQHRGGCASACVRRHFLSGHAPIMPAPWPVSCSIRCLSV